MCIWSQGRQRAERMRELVDSPTAEALFEQIDAGQAGHIGAPTSPSLRQRPGAI